MSRLWAAPGRLAVTALVLVGIAALGFGALNNTRRSSDLQKLTVGVPPLEQNGLLYVAEALHLFEENGLDVTIRDYDTGVDTVNALLAGEVDVAELAEFPFIRPVLEGHALRILAVNDRFENDYLLVRADRGITTPADLRGKTVGLIRGTILEFYLGRFLALNRIGLDEVNIVDIRTPAGTVDAMVAGELDAVVAFQPHAHTIQAGMKDAVTSWPVQNDQLVYGMLVADEAWIEANQDATKRLMAALADAERYVTAHPDEARAIVQEKLGLPADYLAEVWLLHRFTLSLDFSLIVTMNDEARWMIDNGLAEGQEIVPNFAGYVYPDALQAVKPESVGIQP